MEQKMLQVVDQYGKVLERKEFKDEYYGYALACEIADTHNVPILMSAEEVIVKPFIGR